MKRSNSVYRIKTKRVLSRQKSLKAYLRKPECFLKDSFRGGSSRILSFSAGHPTAYEKFIMNKHIKVENTQKRYLSADDPVSKSLISWKINH